MPEISWNIIKQVSFPPGEVLWPWSVAVESLSDLTHLTIKASGSWEDCVGQFKPFSPDGHTGISIQADRLILPDAAVGALLGKLGGSSASLLLPAAGTPSIESRPFPIGSYCRIALPTASFGPLFVGFNWIVRPLRIITLEVEISGASISA